MVLFFANHLRIQHLKYLIAGLGNIGVEYELTRHNIGFLILDRIADEQNIKFEQGRYAFKAEYKFKGRTIHLIKPTTYMNLSGKAVNFWLKELKLGKENMMVVTDDLAIPFGKIRIRKKGSAGGHNGLKNIEESLGGQDYPRLRFGVGSQFSKGHQVDYVLSNFSIEEKPELLGHMDRAVDAIHAFATIGIDRAMNHHNG